MLPLLLLLLAGPSRCTEWSTTLTPHLEVRHEAPFLPPGLLMELGKVHNRLKLDLSMFAPWMSKERIRIHLYKGRESYLNGEFQPPSWSNGLTYSDKKTVVSFIQGEGRSTAEILSHEMTHVLFEGYWTEAGKTAPVWLNEGLAMLEEADDRSQPERSEWFQSMSLLTDEVVLPVGRLVEYVPTQDTKEPTRDAVTLWYIQSYSMVYFLYRAHSRMQFFNFVRGLREGSSLRESLWKVYRFQSLAKFEEAWRRWLKLPENQQRMAAVRVQPWSASAEPPKKGDKRMKPVRFKSLEFRSLLSDGK
ncbi:MAG: hypothetical protein WC728_09785 [Elusimicrobiota bacterium]